MKRLLSSGSLNFARSIHSSRGMLVFICGWFISFHVWAVMPVMSVKQPGNFSTSVREYLVSDRASDIFKHLQNSEHCCTLCSVDCLHILVHASTSFQLKIKEAIQFQRDQPSVNKQLHHVNLKLSF